MVTIVDPNGTPVPIYNRSGVTIVEETSGSPGSPPQMANVVSGRTVAIVSLAPPPGGGNQHIRLPANCEIGDVVEVYGATQGGAQSIDLLPPSGDNFVNGNTPTLIGGAGGTICRKVSSTEWTYLAI